MHNFYLAYETLSITHQGVFWGFSLSEIAAFGKEIIIMIETENYVLVE